MNEFVIKCLLIMEELTKLREVIRKLNIEEGKLITIDESLDEIRNILLESLDY